jgi:hypothetical protein
LQNIQGRGRRKQVRSPGKRRRKKKSGLKKALVALLALVIIAGFIFIFANEYFFRIENISVSENSMYSREDIIRASGIEAGAELFGFDMQAARNNIKKELAYAESVSITRRLPSTVRIDIKTEEPVFGFTLGRDYYIVTGTFRVAEKININEPEAIESRRVINIVTDYITKCFVGEKIEFSDDDIPEFLKELLRLIRSEEAAGIISSVNIRDKFNVVMNYSGEYLVRFGVFENARSKAAGSFDVIKQLREQSLTGIIDMSDGQRASFMPEENISNNRLYFDKK